MFNISYSRDGYYYYLLDIIGNSNMRISDITFSKRNYCLQFFMTLTVAVTGMCGL